MHSRPRDLVVFFERRKAVDQNMDTLVHFPAPAAAEHQNRLFHVLLKSCCCLAKTSKCDNFILEIGAAENAWPRPEERGFTGMQQTSPVAASFEPPKRDSRVPAQRSALLDLEARKRLT